MTDRDTSQDTQVETSADDTATSGTRPVWLVANR